MRERVLTSSFIASHFGRERVYVHVGNAQSPSDSALRAKVEKHAARVERAYENACDWADATDELRSYAEKSAEFASQAKVQPGRYLTRIEQISQNMIENSEAAQQRFVRADDGARGGGERDDRARAGTDAGTSTSAAATPSDAAADVDTDGRACPGCRDAQASDRSRADAAARGDARQASNRASADRSSSAPTGRSSSARASAGRAPLVRAPIIRPPQLYVAHDVLTSVTQLNTAVIGVSPSLSTAMRQSTEALATGLAALNAVSHQKAQQTLTVSATAKAVQSTGSEIDQ